MFPEVVPSGKLIIRREVTSSWLGDMPTRVGGAWDSIGYHIASGRLPKGVWDLTNLNSVKYSHRYFGIYARAGLASKSSKAMSSAQSCPSAAAEVAQSENMR